MSVPRATVVSTLLIGLATLCLCVGLLAISIPRGLGLADESLYVYLLTHPATPMPFMDAFVWGKLAGVLHLNLIAIRWLTLALLLLSGAVLCVAVLRYIDRNVAHDGHMLLWAFGPVFMLSGLVLFYDGSRPTPSYAFTTIFASNIFAATIFATPGNRKWAAIVLQLVGGVMVALAFMARPPSALLLLVWQILFGVLLDKEAKRTIFSTLAMTMASAIATLGVAVFCGYDINGQFALVRVLMVTSHSFQDLVRADVPYGAAIFLVAGSGALIFSLWRADDDASRKSHGNALLLALAVVVLAALGQLWLSGDFRPALPSSSIFFGNPPLKSWGPAIHAVVIGLLIIAANPRLGNKPTSSQDDLNFHSRIIVVRCATLLYLLCPLSQAGTNTGLWHRSIIDMGPLFLAMALILWDFCRRGILAPIQMPLVALLATIPVLAGIYANQIERPPGLNGSIWNHSVALQHPDFLRGIRVPLGVSETQKEIDKELQAANFENDKDVLLPGMSMIGLVDLAGGRGLGNGLYFGGYDGSQVWNCTVAKIGLRQPHRRIFAIEGAQTMRTVTRCIPGLHVGKHLGKSVTELVFDAPAGRPGT